MAKKPPAFTVDPLCFMTGICSCLECGQVVSFGSFDRELYGISDLTIEAIEQLHGLAWEFAQGYSRAIFHRWACPPLPEGAIQVCQRTLKPLKRQPA